MSVGLQFLVASFALTAASTYVTYQSEKKKEKRIKQQLEIKRELARDDLLATKSIADDKLRIDARKRIANITRMFAHRNTQSNTQMAVTGVTSNLEGSLERNQESVNRQIAMTNANIDLNRAELKTPGLATTLVAGAAELGSSVFAAKASGKRISL